MATLNAELISWGGDGKVGKAKPFQVAV